MYTADVFIVIIILLIFIEESKYVNIYMHAIILYLLLNDREIDASYNY